LPLDMFSSSAYYFDAVSGMPDIRQKRITSPANLYHGICWLEDGKFSAVSFGWIYAVGKTESARGALIL
jgi:hypothetical protein